MSTVPHHSMRRHQGNMKLPYISLQNCWIIFRTLTPVKVTTIKGQKCFRNLASDKLPLVITIATQGDLFFMPSIMTMQQLLEKK